MNGMVDNMEVSVEGQVVAETKERVFARICQLLAANDNRVEISYRYYDAINNSEEMKKFIASFPSFFDGELSGNLMACSIIERYLQEEVNTVDDFIGGIINPALLKGKVLKCKEDNETGTVIFWLVSKK